MFVILNIGKDQINLNRIFMIDRNLVISQQERYILLIETGRSKNVESISDGKIELENHGLFVH